MKEYICDVCGHIHKGDGPPDVCLCALHLKVILLKRLKKA